MANPNKFESLEIRDASIVGTGPGWLIILHTKNIGTIDSEIRYLDVNGTIVYKESGLTNADGLVIPIRSEADVWVKVSNPPYVRGTAAAVTIVTTKGNHYTEVVILPEFGYKI